MNEERILILAPMGRDAQLAERALRGYGLAAAVCTDVERLCAAISEGAGACILTEEALFPAAQARLAAVLERQPPWSDLPLIVFGTRESSFGSSANVTLMDRPVRIRTLVSAVQATLRARRRQYQVRDLLSVLETSVKDRDQFLAMLGHELRNPLAAILTAAELIDRQAGDSLRREREVIRRQLRHVTRLVDDLLDVARVTRGKIPLHEEPLDLRKLAERALESFEQAARVQGVELAALEGDRPVRVRGDPLRLEQVVANLLSNAVKYTNRGGRVAVGVVAEGGEAVLRVRDTGVGIAAEVLPHVFDLFIQAPGALDRAQGGMGIGLTLVQRLVELHGGKVSVASEGLGKGSEFVVRLPLLAEEAVPAPAAQKVLPAAAQRLAILVVEDSADARELLQLALEQMGHSVETCGDGNFAVERALQWRPDAMLIDLGLPGRDGYEVARSVRAALGTAVRLIALTGYGQPADRDRALAAGFDAFLVKPAGIDEVDRALRPGK